MQALRAQHPGLQLALATVPIPKLGAEDVLIRVVAAGVTPGVLSLMRAGYSRVPSTVGHEAAGIIAAVGKRVKKVAIGDRVRLHPILSCHQCPACITGGDQMCENRAIMGFAQFGKHSALYDKYHDGAVADFVRSPSWLVDRLPDNVPFDLGAKVHDAATASRALKLAKLGEGSTIVVTAATGSLGALTMRLAHLYNIKKIILIGRSRERLEVVSRLTSVQTQILVIPVEASSETQHGAYTADLRSLAPEGIDAIIDYLPSGNLLTQILAALKPGGTLVHIGGNAYQLRIPLITIMANFWTITGGRGSKRADAVECLEWMEKGSLSLDGLITHRYPAAEVDKLLHLMESRAEPMWLSVIDMLDSSEHVTGISNGI